MRLGLYIDATYRRRPSDGRVLTSFETLPFLRFGCEVGSHFSSLVVFGREAPEGGAEEHPLPEGVGLAPLPFYPNLAQVPKVASAAVRTVFAMWRGLGGVDAVWVFGPHPFGLVLALLALVRRRRVVLGVRQDTMRYFRSRLRRPATAPLLAPLWLLDRAWRALARAVPVTVVGEELEHRYRGPRPGVLSMQISLVRSADVAAAPRSEPLRDEPRLLTVGRVDAEKNPLLLVEAVAALRAAGVAVHSTWVGSGPLVEAVRARAAELGVADAIELPGFVPPGEGLIARYRDADAFVHVAVTEGVPQVLMEALACATPVVATGVGGVPRALEEGAAGLVVPPRDRDALVAAIRELVGDEEGRRRRAARGIELARERSLDVEGARVARWLQQPR